MPSIDLYDSLIYFTLMKKDDYINNLLAAAATTIATQIEDQIGDLGLPSTNAATALVTIRNHPDDSIDALRRVLSLTHSGAVRLIDSLEQDGLVERRRSDTDGRAVVLRLTANGQDSAEVIIGARERATRAIVKRLSKQQIAGLKPVLETILAVTTKDEESARRNCRLCDESACRPLGCPVEISAQEHRAKGP
ncbi:MarR family winged helix-turn-helix transcriptional regulator [Denitrobaculum tricleocarpae]|uniref:MarR family transcriptional regulator n=1 Tax=Denitrobaculum tricleocarpae TaxID=2591009 RepID=A0A545TMV5_9PROT|nr:MarR family transcriptional regulator [Denitrobaculum tricleocarpae]TQV78565.1 MarR family transcriptional regulator [Denitrobaculum tricleocarpae]